jgi:hypothetical protein
MEKWGSQGLLEIKPGFPPKKTEILPIHLASPEAIISFFREAYGQAYQGDDNLGKKIARSSHVVVLEDPDKSSPTAGAALIAHRRILTMATSANPEYKGLRHSNAVTLMEECMAQLGCQWVTIGQEYPRMQRVASEAGMSRVSEPELVQGLLAEAGEEDNYAFSYDHMGKLLVTRVASEFRPDYEQQFWVRLTTDVTTV